MCGIVAATSPAGNPTRQEIHRLLAVLGLGAVAIFRQRDELQRLALLVSWATLPLLVALGIRC
jgi:hypothetical protein